MELKGYGKYYIFDCNHPQIKVERKQKTENWTKFLQQTCRKENKDRNPLLGIYKQPALRRNPYTGEKMKTEYVPYSEGNISPQLFKKWITNALSDFTTKITNERDFNIYIKNKEDKDINKVIIFTKREKVAPAIKSLSAEYRDTLRISVISVLNDKPTEYQKELMRDYEIEELPKLVVEQTYDPQSDEVLAQYRIHDY